MAITLPDIESRRRVASPQRRVQGYSTAAYEAGNNAAARSLGDAAAAVSGIASEREARTDERNRVDEAERKKRKAIDLVERKRVNAAFAQDRSNFAQKRYQDLLYGAGEDTGIYGKSGQGAINGDSVYDKESKIIMDEALKDVTDPTAKDALKARLDSMDISNRGGVRRHTLDQGRKYRSDVSETNFQLARESVGLNPDDNEYFRAAHSQAQTASFNKSMADGVSDEQNMLNQKKSGSAMHTERLMSWLNSSDPKKHAQAAMYYDNVRKSGHLVMDDVKKLDGYMDSLVPMAQANAAYASISGNTGIEVQSTDDIFTSMLNVESGGKHFQDDGSITESPVGAKGIAQLMEPTAREQAEKMGIDPETWLDADVNEKLGRAYLKQQVKYFGDNALGVLSYNWGMGNVNKHIKKVGDPRKGEISMDEFIAKIDSDEAREYVPKVIGGLGGGSGRIDPLKAAEQAAGMSDDAGRMFSKNVKKHNISIDRAQTIETRDILDGAFSIILSTEEGYVSQLPLSMATRAREAGFYKELNEYAGFTHDNTADYLYSLSPQELKETDLNTPGIRLKLSMDDYDMWEKKKEALDSPAMMVTAESRNSSVNNAFLELNISTRTDEGKQKKNRVNALLDVRINAFTQEHNGRSPNPSEVETILDGVFMSKDFYPGSALNPWNWGGYRNIFDITMDDISSSDQDKLINSLKRRGEAVTDATIINEYIKNTRGQETPVKP